MWKLFPVGWTFKTLVWINTDISINLAWAQPWNSSFTSWSYMTADLLQILLKPHVLKLTRRAKDILVSTLFSWASQTMYNICRILLYDRYHLDWEYCILGLGISCHHVCYTLKVAYTQKCSINIDIVIYFDTWLFCPSIKNVYNNSRFINLWPPI